MCTHLLPNRLQLLSEDAPAIELPGETVNYQVTLSESNRAELQDGTLKVEGTWTMLYDQGMIIEFPGHMRFYANFKYTLKSESHSADSIKELSEASYEAFNSQCDETMVGFVMPLEANGGLRNPATFGCFTGYNPESKQRMETSEQI